MDKISILDIILNRDEGSPKVEGRKKGEIFCKEFSGAITKRMQRLLSRRFFKLTKAIAHLLSHVSTKIYGAVCLSLGLFGIISYFAFLIFNIPSPYVLAMIIAITNVIPILGPFIGGIPCAFTAKKITIP